LFFFSLCSGSNSYYIGDIEASENAAKSIFTILDSVDEEELSKGKSSPAQLDGEIEFKNVTFKYPQRDLEVLKDVSLKIPAGNKVAFVGPSGAGKSSIIQLIMRFYGDYKG